MERIANFAAVIFAMCIIALAPNMASANVITDQQTKTEHLRTCLGKGNKKEVCLCSYDKVTKVISTENLMALNRAISNKIPKNEEHQTALKDAITACEYEIRDGKYTPSSSLPVAPSLPTAPTLPPLTTLSTLPNPDGTTTTPAIPTPPTFSDLDNLTIPAPPTIEKASPNFDADSAEKGSENYFTDTEADIDANEDPKKLATKTVPSTAYTQEDFNVQIDDLRDKYQGQHDRAFFEAAARGDIKALTAINQYLKSPDILDRVGNTPLLVAVQNGQANATSFLISNGANANLANKTGQAALHIAVFKKRQDIVQLLLRSKANVNLAYANGFTPLILALMNRDEVMIQTLIIAGANVKQAMADGNLPIHVAVSTDSANIIQILRNYGADINAENAQGYTPLMVAASQNKTNAASALLALGADYNRTDIYGRTAAQIAYSLGNQQIVNLILTVQEQQSRKF